MPILTKFIITWGKNTLSLGPDTEVYESWYANSEDKTTYISNSLRQTVTGYPVKIDLFRRDWVEQ